MSEKTTIIDIGNAVRCDSCNEDYTNSEKEGGFIFNRKAICPQCAKDWEEGAKKYGETKYITSRCAAGQSFKAFVLAERDGDNTITIQEL